MKAFNTVALCIGLSVVLAGPVRAENVVVVKGATTRIAVAEGVQRLSVANPTVADARPDGDGKAVLVQGLAEGSTDLRIERLQGAALAYTIQVTSDLQNLLGQIKELLSEVDGLDVKVVGNKIVLKGSVLTKSDYDRVMKVAEAYASVVLNMAKLDRTEMSKFVEEAIVRDIGCDTVKVRVSEDTAVLEGVVYSDADLARAGEMAKLRVPIVKNLLRVQEVMIETDVHFVQVDKSSASDIGYNVLKGASIGGSFDLKGGTATPTVNSFSVNASLTAKINALVGAGTAKILAQPHLSTKSGGEGTFHSGGATYFAVSGVNAGSLEKIEYGIILKVKPTLQGRDRIMNEVTIEVSVPSAKPQGTFSLEKFDTKSVAMCKVGESIMLSGLVQSLATQFKEKTPLLGDIPLLSMFFSNKQKSNESRELIVLISPKPIFPQADNSPAFSKEREHLLNEKPAAP
jgi:pilus assembly protein CpaC